MRADRAEAADIIDLDFHKAIFFFFSPPFFSIQYYIEDWRLISPALIAKFSIGYKKKNDLVSEVRQVGKWW